MKKLIPAICLLLITAMVLGTSTYAWFTTNDSVSANDLQLRAKTGENLLIGTTSVLSEMSESITLPAYSATDAAMKPVSTADLQNWFQQTAAAVSSEEGKDGNNKFDSADLPYNQTFYLWSANDSHIYLENLEVLTKTSEDGDWTAVDFTAGTLFNSLRVAIKSGDDFCIYAPTAATADGSKTAGEGSQAGSEATAIAVKSATEAPSAINPESGKMIFHAVGTNDANYVAFDLDAETMTTCNLYVWFEGTDGSCFTNNFTKNMIKVSFDLHRSNVEATE